MFCCLLANCKCNIFFYIDQKAASACIAERLYNQSTAQAADENCGKVTKEQISAYVFRQMRTHMFGMCIKCECEQVRDQ